MLNLNELLPIGSIVRTIGADKRLMIIGIKPFEIETETEHDYLAILYPEGYIGDSAMYFVEHADIDEIIYPGYEDEERVSLINRLQHLYNEENGE